MPTNVTTAKTREQIELDAGERQQAGRPDEPDAVGSRASSDSRQSAEREHDSATTMSVPIARPLRNCGRKRPRQLAVDERQAGQRLRRIDRVDDRLERRRPPRTFEGKT